MEIPKCINGNKAAIICISDEYNYSNPFICAICTNNYCKQLHDECITTDWYKIKRKIEKSKKPKNPEILKLSNSVQQPIAESIKNLQKQLQTFNIWKQTFGMPNEAINLFRSIQENQEYKFTGKEIVQILKRLKATTQIQKFNQTKIKQQKNQILEKMQQIQRMIRSIYSTQDIQYIKVPTLSMEIKQTYLEKIQTKD